MSQIISPEGSPQASPDVSKAPGPKAPAIRIVRGRWHNGELLPPAPLTASFLGRAPSPGATPGPTPCLAHVVDTALIDNTRDRSALDNDLERIRLIRGDGTLLLNSVVRREDAELVVFDCAAPCSLADRLVESRFFGWEETARIFAVIARLLDNLHRTGFLLGYLDPSFIQLGPETAVQLMAIGPARALTLRLESSDPRVAADVLPDALIAGQAPTPATDLFFVGCTAIRVLTGVSMTPELCALAARPDDLLRALVARAGRDFDIPRTLLDSITLLILDAKGQLASAGRLASELKTLSQSQTAQAMELLGVSGPDEAAANVAGSDRSLGTGSGSYGTDFKPPPASPGVSHSYGAPPPQHPAKPLTRSLKRVFVMLLVVLLAGYFIMQGMQIPAKLKVLQSIFHPVPSVSVPGQ